MNGMEVFLAQALYLERVRKAEEAYRRGQMLSKTPRRISPFRIRLGDLLIAYGSRLKGAGRISYVGT